MLGAGPAPLEAAPADRPGILENPATAPLIQRSSVPFRMRRPRGQAADIQRKRCRYWFGAMPVARLKTRRKAAGSV